MKQGKLPELLLADSLYLGPVPDVLKDLTAIEEAKIARCCAKSQIVQLKEDADTRYLPNAQRGVQRHIIIYAQRPSEIAKVLPPSIFDILTPVCILFIGSQKLEMFDYIFTICTTYNYSVYLKFIHLRTKIYEGIGPCRSRPPALLTYFSA